MEQLIGWLITIGGSILLFWSVSEWWDDPQSRRRRTINQRKREIDTSPQNNQSAQT